MAVAENDLIVGPVVPASGVDTISLDFYVENAEWLDVYKTGSETPLVLDTDYTFSGAGTSTGTVTLTTPANGTDAYSVYLSVPLGRSSDLQFRGDFRSNPFNLEFDRIWQALQGVKTLALRTVSLSRTSPDLPPLTFNAGDDTDDRALVFSPDSSKLVPGPTATEVANAQGYATAAAASATNAANSETAAAASATAAGNSASAAAASASAASDSETAAADSATAAASSATNAATSETNAGNSATAAATSETNAANSATAADADADTAAGAATAAAASATAAANSATAADAAATDAENAAAQFTKATQAQAETGTDNDTYMTPLRTAQAIAAQAASGGMTLLDSIIGASGGSISVTGLDLSGYKTVRIVIDGLRLNNASGGNNVRLEIGGTNTNFAVANGAVTNVRFYGVIEIDVTTGVATFNCQMHDATATLDVDTANTTGLSSSETEIGLGYTGALRSFNAGDVYFYGIA